MKKEVYYLIFLLCVQSIYAIGISPTYIKIDFKPNLVYESEFVIFSEGNQQIQLSLEGDFAKYITLDKKTLNGPGKVKVTIRLPQELNEPGDHAVLLSAKEVNNPGGTVGATVGILARIIMRVPFEGKYILPPELKISDTNVNEATIAQVKIQSFGTENIENIFAQIDIFDFSRNKILSKITETQSLPSLKEITLQTLIDTTNFKPGTYNGEAIIFYEEKQEKTNQVQFKVGLLEVKIKNYTKEIIQDQINSFEIEIESGWNNPIEDIFAEVIIKDNEQTTFRTVNTILLPWEKKVIKGFVDATNKKEGIYPIEINLKYKDQTTTAQGMLIIKKQPFLIKKETAFIILIIILIILTNTRWFFKLKKKKLQSFLFKYFLSPLKK